MTEQEQLRRQVEAQCRAVAHMATALAEIHQQKAAILAESTAMDGVLAVVGPSTAYLMEELGEMLNNMDAVTDEDDWVNPVLAEARRLFGDDEPPAKVDAVLG